MENMNGRFRKKHTNFSMVSNTALDDENLTLKAKGLYSLIQRYITLDSFTLYKGFLQSKCKGGKDSFNSAWKELKDSGYLVQYKMRDEKTKKIYWEYELLDEVNEPCTENPHTEKPCMEKPYTEKPYDGSSVSWVSHVMENGGDINNTINNNTIQNNNISNHIISINDVIDQIGLIAFNDSDLDQAKQIIMLITEVLNTPDEKKIHIAKSELPASQVKERFRSLNHFHIDYVLECIKKNTKKISSVKNYLLTTLYNAPLTMDTYYQNKLMIYKRE